MVQLIFNQQSLPTSLLGFVKNEVEKIGNGRLMHPSIKNYFGILLRWFYARATLFVYKVYTVIERLFLWMVLRPELKPSILYVFWLCFLPWACLSESTFIAVGVVLSLSLPSPCFFCLFCITLPYHSLDSFFFFPDGQSTVSETLQLFYFLGFCKTLPSKHNSLKETLNFVESCFPPSSHRICDFNLIYHFRRSFFCLLSVVLVVFFFIAPNLWSSRSVQVQRSSWCEGKGCFSLVTFYYGFEMYTVIGFVLLLCIFTAAPGVHRKVFHCCLPMVHNVNLMLY